jgi:hypothetical protein
MSQSTIIEIAREESIVALHNFDLVWYALESFEDLLPEPFLLINYVQVFKTTVALFHLLYF